MTFPELDQGVMFFNGHQVDLDHGSIAELELMFGSALAPIVISSYGSISVLHYVFELAEFEDVRAPVIVIPEGEIVGGLDITLTDDAPLRLLQALYGQPVITDFPGEDESLCTWAVFNSNLVAKLDKDQSVHKLEFLNARYVQDCECDFCQGVLRAVAERQSTGLNQIRLQ